MEHGQEVLDTLRKLGLARDGVLNGAMAALQAAGGDLFKIDLFVLGAAKRTVSLVAGFDVMVRTFNVVCARALIRMQLDTALRLAALGMVADPEAFADAVLGDERIDRLVDRDGKRLRDAYLVEKLAPIAPWLPEVYKRTSGYVHLSGQHIFASVQEMDDETGVVTLMIGAEDRNFPAWSWVEMVDCFEAGASLVGGQIRAWQDIKTGQRRRAGV